MPITSMGPQTLQRLPQYMHYFKLLSNSKVLKVTSKSVAEALSLDPISVYHDFMALCPSAIRRSNFDIQELKREIRKYVFTPTIKPVVVVGAGKLGKALLGYAGFTVYGLDIMAAFDIDQKVLARKDPSGKPIYHIRELKNTCRRLNAKIGIITVPGDVLNPSVINSSKPVSSLFGTLHQPI
jgi:redox-sensing transcriptional repressor